MRGMRRRLRLNRYKRLEYLEFIDFYRKTVPLGIKTTPDMSIKFKVSAPQSSYYCSFLQTMADSYSKYFGLGKNPAGAITYTNKGTSAIEIAKSNGAVWDVYITSLSRSTNTIHDGRFAQLGINYGLEYDLVIGINKYLENNWSRTTEVKLYYLIIDDGNGQKLDLQPVKRLEDGKTGLLDRVSGKFFDFTGMVKQQ